MKSLALGSATLRPDGLPPVDSCIPSQGLLALSLTVKLTPLHIHTVLRHRHPEVFHRKDRPVLATAGATAAVAGPLDSQRASAALVLGARHASLLSRCREARRRAEIAHRIVAAGVARSDPAVLVRIGGDVGDELLRRQRKKSRQPLVCLRGWREARSGHVVVCHRVGDLEGTPQGLAEAITPREEASDRATAGQGEFDGAG